MADGAGEAVKFPNGYHIPSPAPKSLCTVRRDPLQNVPTYFTPLGQKGLSSGCRAFSSRSMSNEGFTSSLLPRGQSFFCIRFVFAYGILVRRGNLSRDQAEAQNGPVSGCP